MPNLSPLLGPRGSASNFSSCFPPPSTYQSAYERKLKRKIASYLDTEAIGNDEGDEDDQEEKLSSQDFISDVSDSDASSSTPFEPPPSNLQSSIQEEMEECKRIAQRLAERARQERAVIPVHEETLDKHNLRSLVPTSSNLTSSPLYAYRVPPHTEEQLLQYLTPSPHERPPLAGIKCAFTKAYGSGTVYVETSDLAALFNYMKRYSDSRCA
ncbi:hypothetical protein K438DRAFT_2030116 [Mycena galopus ATCC 62051]|nr:hypothetical protein K438DRAFT_2030116 [Mycena galopus ATCC 62051]